MTLVQTYNEFVKAGGTKTFSDDRRTLISTLPEPYKFGPGIISPDEISKRENAAHIAGLKEADDAWRAGVHHAMNVIVLTGPPGFEEFRDRVIERLTEHRNRGQADIRARISALEKDHA